MEMEQRKPRIAALLLLVIFVLLCTCDNEPARIEKKAKTQRNIEQPTANMVLIPAGEFLMGSPPGEGEDDERPQHKVYVDAFYMDKYEVTNEQYKNFCDTSGYRYPPNPDFDEKYFLTKPKHPAVCMSWFDATAYAEWAGKRLPTEAEWEYACRAGSTTKYYTGDTISHDDANFNGVGGKDQWDEGTAPVGSFPPNQWGLYDMHGNVWELCSDWYGRHYYRESPSENPKGPKEGFHRVDRGGSWQTYSTNVRSATRSRCQPDVTHVMTRGFRCALDAE